MRILHLVILNAQTPHLFPLFDGIGFSFQSMAFQHDSTSVSFVKSERSEESFPVYVDAMEREDQPVLLWTRNGCLTFGPVCPVCTEAAA